MNWIIPLAGPDILHPSYGYKPLQVFDGRKLIDSVIESRPWYQEKSSHEEKIFVLRDIDAGTELEDYLKQRYCGSRFVKLGAATRGALFSVLGGSCIASHDEVVIVDLADIIFKSNINVLEEFYRNDALGALLPTFQSTNEKYSYAVTEGNQLVRAVEKEVISDKASAGVYIYRNLELLLESVLLSLRSSRSVTFDDKYFVCPSLGVLAEKGVDVRTFGVSNVIPLSLLFKS